jgi:hypothetical protein
MAAAGQARIGARYSGAGLSAALTAAYRPDWPA